MDNEPNPPAATTRDSDPNPAPATEPAAQTAPAPADYALALTTPCPHCGYDLAPLTFGSRCPECGRVPLLFDPTRVRQGPAALALLLGVVSLVAAAFAAGGDMINIGVAIGGVAIAAIAIASAVRTSWLVQSRETTPSDLLPAYVGLIAAFVASAIWLAPLV